MFQAFKRYERSNVYKDNSVSWLLLSRTDTLQRDNEKLRAINS